MKMLAMDRLTVAKLRYALAVVVVVVGLGTPVAGALQLAPPVTNESVAARSPVGAPSTASPPSVEEDIRGLRPPYHIANPWMWLAYAGGALAVLALGVGGARWLRRASAVPQLSLRDATLRHLEEARRLMQPEHAREFSIAVSEVVRDYVHQRFEVSATQLTTWEFLHYLTARTDSPLAGYRPLLGEFLFHCDAAKFARWILSESEMEVMFQSARRFVEETSRETGSAQGPAKAETRTGSPGESMVREHSTPTQGPGRTPSSSGSRVVAST